MSFKIDVRNDGETARVTVSQRINLNENAQLHDGVIEADATISLDCYRTEDDADEGGTFDWTHGGSGLTDFEFVRAGAELIVK